MTKLLRRATIAVNGRDDMLINIRLHLDSEAPVEALPLHQQQMYNRMLEAYNMFFEEPKERIIVEGVNDEDALEPEPKSTYYDRAATIRKHAQKWHQHENTSRKDLANAFEIFAEQSQNSKLADKEIGKQMVLAGMKQVKYSKDPAMAQAKLALAWSEITGLKKEDPNVPKAEDFRQPIIEIADEFTRLVMEKLLQLAANSATTDLSEIRVVDLLEGVDFSIIEQLTLPPADE
jgi:hypothetical protein